MSYCSIQLGLDQEYLGPVFLCIQLFEYMLTKWPKWLLVDSGVETSSVLDALSRQNCATEGCYYSGALVFT